jgi:hypothetical protein
VSNKLRIGWAARDITPRCPVALRGQFNLRIATRVQDPLTLTALALERTGEQAVMVSLDLVAADNCILDRIRPALAARVPELDPRKVILCATHTHTGPFTGLGQGLQTDAVHLDAIRARYPDYMGMEQYGAFLSEAIVDAVCEAWGKRAEGSVGWGYSYAVVGENRRERYFDNRAVMYGPTNVPDFSHIEGHVDHGVQMLFTYDDARALTGVVVNVACPSQVSEGGQDFVSADFWHDTRNEIRRRRGDGLFILPQCSAAGDQSPHRQINTRAEDRMLALKYDTKPDPPLNSALRRDIARRLADAVDDAEPAARKDRRDQVVLKHEYRTLDLPHWDVTDAEYESLQTQIADLTARLEALVDADPLGGEYTATLCMRAWCQHAADRYEHPLPSVPVEISVLRLGDVALTTAPFEFYLDFGDRIKGRSAATQTLVVQLTGGGPYLPTERAAAGLSYGAVPASCTVAPAGGQIVVDETVSLIAAMFEEG